MLTSWRWKIHIAAILSLFLRAYYTLSTRLNASVLQARMTPLSPVGIHSSTSFPNSCAAAASSDLRGSLVPSTKPLWPGKASRRLASDNDAWELRSTGIWMPWRLTWSNKRWMIDSYIKLIEWLPLHLFICCICHISLLAHFRSIL